MNEIKNQIEAILFAAGKKVTYELIARLCNLPLATIKDNLMLLKKEYEERQSPLLITEEVDGWKITVREKYLLLVQKLMPDTELSKSILETLAVIAWKQPVMQSEVIHLRTTKAYEHIQELEETGFIIKERKGRSYLLKTTHKFYEYFDLPGKEALKELFKHIQEEGQRKVEEFEKVDVYSEEETNEEEETKNLVKKLEVYKDPAEQKEQKTEQETGTEDMQENGDTDAEPNTPEKSSEEKQE